MIELNPKIKKTLLDINFIKRYEFLSNSSDNVNTPLKERLRYFDGVQTMLDIGGFFFDGCDFVNAAIYLVRGRDKETF